MSIRAYSRTSACCNKHVQIRAGSDIAFLGGLINYVLIHEKWFKEFVLAYTNASTIISDDFRDTEDLEGIFSGFDKEKRSYDAGDGHWVYEDSPADRKKPVKGETTPEAQGPGGPGKQGAGEREVERGSEGMHGPGLMGGASTHSSKRSDYHLR